jgi:hypothetical protein
MTKKEALQFLKEKTNLGYITHSLIIEALYEDGDEIPKEMLEACHHKPKKRDYYPYTGVKGMEKFNKIYKKNESNS